MKKILVLLLIAVSVASAQVVYNHISGLAVDADGTVSEPAIMFGQDIDTGIYRVSANTLGIAVGGSQVFRAASSGVIVTGSVTCTSASITGAVSGASVTATGDVTVGGYERLSYLKFQDDFIYGNDTRYAADYDIVSYAVSAGSGDSNTVISTPGSVVLTSGDAANDTQVTASILAYITRAMLPRTETKVTLASVSGVEFRWGLYNGATKYCFILFDASADSHWKLVLNDGTGEQAYTSTSTVTTNATTLELSIAADGTPAWKVNGTTMPITGISKKLTADSYKLYTGVLSEGTANKTAALGYIEIDTVK